MQGQSALHFESKAARCAYPPVLDVRGPGGLFRSNILRLAYSLLYEADGRPPITTAAITVGRSFVVNDKNIHQGTPCIAQSLFFYFS